MLAPGILVPGAAGAAGIDAIRRIRVRHPQLRIIASDRDPLAAGFWLADDRIVTEPLATKGEVRRVCDLLVKQNVKVILATDRNDTRDFARASAKLANIGVQFVGSSARVVELCDDKVRLKQRMSGHVLTADAIEIASHGPCRYPCFVKPRSGSGGTLGLLCHDNSDWARHVSRYGDAMMAEEYLPGPEYSVDVFSCLDATPMIAVPRTRLRTMDGVSTVTRVLELPELSGLAMKVAAWLSLRGPSCIQFREDSDGNLRLQEVNARLGGSSIASALAGVDLVDLSVRAGLNLPIKIGKPQPMVVVRYLSEFAVPG